MCGTYDVRVRTMTYLGVLDGHDDAGGQDELLPGLADVEDVDAILKQLN